MPGVTKEQIERAKQWDLLSYLQTYEPQELKKCGGQEYRTVSHDSLKISNGKWNWHSRGIGGRTALDYLIKVRGQSFVEAVETLCGERGAARWEPPPPVPKPKPPKPFALPAASRCGTVMVSYLQGRGIDADIISRCIGQGILYESSRYHNCVFVGRDLAGKARFASLRGVSDNFKIDVEGSDKQYSFHLPASVPDSPFVAVAESPVDALSIASILKMQGDDWEKYHYLSLSGTAPNALLQFLHDHPAVTCVSLCLDNDKAGLSGMAKIREAIQADPELSLRVKLMIDNPPPVFCGKDYNDLAKWKHAALRREKERAGPQKVQAADR